MAKSTSSNFNIVGPIALLLFMAHLMVIAGDVQTIMNDPRKENKSTEVLKLAFDLTRYFG